MKRILLILVIMVSQAAGWAPISTAQIIKMIDTVVYGTAERLPDHEMTIRKAYGKREDIYHYVLVDIHPWLYVPGLSVRYYHQETYRAWISAESWGKGADYASAPRFWGLKDQDIPGSLVRELPPDDRDLRELKEYYDHQFKDKTYIRPLSIAGVTDSLTLKTTEEGGQRFLEIHNGSEFRVWCKKIAAGPLNLKVDSYTFRIDGQRADGSWNGSALGLDGNGVENQFVIPVEIKPKASLRFPITVETASFKRFRAHVVLYPSSQLLNGRDVSSEAFSLDP